MNIEDIKVGKSYKHNASETMITVISIYRHWIFGAKRVMYLRESLKWRPVTGYTGEHDIEKFSIIS